MELMYFLSRLSQRLPYICRLFLYNIIRFVVPVKNEYIDKPNEYLSRYKEDCGGSCIASTIIKDDYNYDLQVIVPVYNVQKYLRECMDSIINQETQYQFCIIAVNDGSTDDSYEILKQYQSYDNVKIVNQNNKGIAGARNAALHVIDAKYVMFVDSDDVLAPGAVETLLSLAYNTDVDIVQGTFDTIGANGKNIKHIQNNGFCHPQNLKGFPFGKVFRSFLWRNIQFPERYDYEDTLNRLIIFNIAKSAYICPDVVYHYRINESGVTRTTVGNYKLIDSVWVTLSLHNDALQLNLTGSKEYTEALVYQLMFNMVRVASLKNNNINRAIFYLYRGSIDFLQLERPVSKLACQAYDYLVDNKFKKFYLSSIILK